MNKEGKLWVSEKFVSIQGEGIHQGMPAAFVRTAYCNLHCQWCDAWYTWDHSRINVKTDAKLEDIRHVANWIACQKMPLVVLTGGEPLLQEEALYDIVVMSNRASKRFQFETNGTMMPRTPLAQMSYVDWVVSPKLGNNEADPPNRRIKLEVLNKFARMVNTTFKFVVRDMADIETIRCLNLPRTWLMPMGTTSKELDERMPMVIRECIRYGWRYSDRLHIRAWGDQRGR
jgi:organic radical activating enzyme